MIWQAVGPTYASESLGTPLGAADTQNAHCRDGRVQQLSPDHRETKRIPVKGLGQ